MARFDRLVIVILALMLCVASGVLIAVVQFDLAGAIGRLAALANWLEGREDGPLRLATTAAAGFSSALGLAILVLHLRRPMAPAIRIRAASGERIVIPTDSAERLIANELRLIPSVASARAAVTPPGPEASVAVELDLDPDAIISAVTRSVSEQVQRLFAERLGIRLHDKPTVSVRYDELVLSGRPATPPAATAPVTAWGPGPNEDGS